MNKDADFEEMVKEIQRKIEREEEAKYSKKVIKEYRDPTNFGVVNNPDALGKIKGSCGDTMKVTLRIEKGIIKNACFWTDGCGASIACGNMLLNMAKGKTIEKATNISNGKLLEALDGLPKEHKHCAILAVDALHEAIKNYQFYTLQKVNR